jgi:ABC-2 type transport system permease protein
LANNQKQNNGHQIPHFHISINCWQGINRGFSEKRFLPLIFLLFSRLLVILHLDMYTIIKKELRQFFSGMLGYITIGIFLLITGIIVFVLPESGVLDAGYATLDPFFSFAPYLMLFLMPAITMRSMSDEYRSGTFEVLRTAPVSIRDLVAGKFIACFLVALMALLCTLVYPFALHYLSTDGIDTGGIAGSYIGMLLLCGVYASIGVFTSSLQQNAVTAFLTAALICFLGYSVFDSIAAIDGLPYSVGYYISQAGIMQHYQNISKGYVDTRDLIYFLSLIFFFLYLTIQQVKAR